MAPKTKKNQQSGKREKTTKRGLLRKQTLGGVEHLHTCVHRTAIIICIQKVSIFLRHCTSILCVC